jgi:endonuclease/exonuclease/phosphatase family metal-dependent hydrolase
MILFLTHLKSRLDPEGKDPNGYLRRKAELLALIEIYKQMQSKWNGQIPIVVAGDFNGNASEKNTDPEFIPLYQHTDLKDVCWLAQKSDDDRATYYQVSRNNRTEARQIDFAFLSPRAQKLLVPESVQVYRYRDHLGIPYSPPTSLDEKMRLPSDHYPLIFQLRGIKI